ncbi:hypothetical protein Pmani_031869 [Petrolisthes manimaculis]|uniref:Uncharacterized protein n=1 Tax=Petrolisthes manimaculis TaxID=1843537 RepID=A0AAE1NTT4_9EUCA|nr:hypothetical protein Pmani_031869 [Petrolisthes manimaculis]
MEKEGFWSGDGDKVRREEGWRGVASSHHTTQHQSNDISSSITSSPTITVSSCTTPPPPQDEEYHDHHNTGALKAACTVQRGRACGGTHRGRSAGGRCCRRRWREIVSGECDGRSARR